MELPDAISYRPIGVIRSPHADPVDAPIQPAGARGVRGTVEVDAALEPALEDLEGFSHVVLLYHCHRAAEAKLRVIPYLGDVGHGVLATRAPARPNPIGLSVVRLVGVRGPVLDIEDVDVLDGTPLLDVKPFVPAFDVPEGPIRIGWLEGRSGNAGSATADGRFHGEP